MRRLSIFAFLLLCFGNTLAQTVTPVDATQPIEVIETRSVSGTGTEGASMESVNGTGLESVNGTGLESVNGTGLESVNGTGLESVNGTGLESVNGTGLESVNGTGTLAVSGQSYQVRQGDTLGSIATKLLGDASRWQQLYNANRNVLSHPDTLVVGTTLTIPAAE